MEGERTFMKNKKLLAKLIFVAILLLIIWYTFKDSAEDIVEQLGKTSLTVLVAIMAATVISGCTRPTARGHVSPVSVHRTISPGGR